MTSVAMDQQLAVLFYIGILIPTIITVAVFIGFLICWFKCNLKERLVKSKHKTITPKRIKEECLEEEKYEKGSQHSADSAIDVGEVETSIEEADQSKSANLELASGELILDAKMLSHHSMRATASHEMMSDAELRSRQLIRGSYPSHEKLNEEVHSPVKIYERVDVLQNLLVHKTPPSLTAHLLSQSQQPDRDNLAATVQKPFSRKQLYLSAPRLQTMAYTSQSTDSQYGFLPWRRISGNSRRASEPRAYSSHYNSNSSWQPNIIASCSSNADNYSTVESSHLV